MKIIPAIDLKDNKCVRLSKGKVNSARIYNRDPVAQAQFFEKNGCKKIHVIDLDAAFGRKNINKDTIIEIKNSVKIPIQLGGGIRSKEDAVFFLKNKIDFIIVGSMAVTNNKIVKEISDQFENRVYIAMDIKNKKNIMIKGWLEKSDLKSIDINNLYKNYKIKGYILTNIDKDGMMEGPDYEFVKSQIHLYNKPIIFSGGFSDYESLEFLSFISKDLKNKNKIEGAILGKGFYSGKVEIKKAIKAINKYAQS